MTRVKHGDPRVVIRALADAGGHDLVVLGTHARRGLPRFLLGSVAVDLLRSSLHDVLVIPPAGRAR